MGIVIWIVVGLLAGLIARALFPGPQAMGIIATILLGLVGSFVGGLVGMVVWHHDIAQFTPGGLLLSALGAIVVLLIWGAASRRRPVRP